MLGAVWGLGLQEQFLRSGAGNGVKEILVVLVLVLCVCWLLVLVWVGVGGVVSLAISLGDNDRPLTASHSLLPPMTPHPNHTN